MSGLHADIALKSLVELARGASKSDRQCRRTFVLGVVKFKGRVPQCESRTGYNRTGTKRSLNGLIVVNWSHLKGPLQKLFCTEEIVSFWVHLFDFHQRSVPMNGLGAGTESRCHPNPSSVSLPGRASGNISPFRLRALFRSD